MIRETRLPNRWPRFQPIRKSSLDELHGPLQGNLRPGRQQCVHMIGHDDEFVEKEFSLIAIMRESFNQKPGRCLASKDRLTMSSNGRDKEDPIRIHFEMIVGTVGPVCARCHNSQRGISKRYTGPKGRVFSSAPQRGPQRAALPRRRPVSVWPISVWPISVWPSPVSGLGLIDAVLVCVVAAFDLLVEESLFGMSANSLKFGHAIDDVHGKAEAVDVVVDGQF